MRKIVIICIACIAAFSFYSCSKSSVPSSLVGTNWYWEGSDGYSNKTLNFGQYEATCFWEIYSNSGWYTVDYTYNEGTGTIHSRYSGYVTTFKIEGDTLTVGNGAGENNTSDLEAVYTKQF
jgi:hypothetical protein